MKIYNNNSATKELINESEARLSPLEKGVYLIPANATTLTPLKAKDGFAVVFNGSAWQYIKDERGKTFYDEKGNEITITELGADTSKLSKDNPQPNPKQTELEAQIKEAEDDIRRAILIGNDSVLPELRAEYKELLAQKQALEKGETNEKEN